MTTVAVTERQLRALAKLVVYYPQLGTLFPCGDGEYLTDAEMADLDRRFKAVLDPIKEAGSAVTTEG